MELKLLFNVLLIYLFRLFPAWIDFKMILSISFFRDCDSMKNIHKIFTALSFLLPLVIYILTMAPTTSFWDCGEYIATSRILGVPHPPGTPLFLLLGNVFSNLPTFTDVGAKVNLISPIVSAFSVMFLYLIIVQFINRLLLDDE